MIKVWRFLSIPIILAVCLGLALVPAAPVLGAVGDCGIEIDPSAQNVGFNEAFSVDIVINNPDARELDMVMCHINFSAALIEVVNITNVGSPFDTKWAESYNNTAGWVDYDYSTPMGTNITETAPYLCTVDMKSKSATGIATLEFVAVDGYGDPETAVLSTGSDYLVWTMVVNGTVTVTGAPRLWVNVTPNGTGTVTANGVTLIGYPNITNWTTGENVTLEAFPVGGWEFNKWTGNLTGSTNPDTITMDSDKNVTANFTELPPEISPDPSSLTFSGNVGAALANQTLDICNGGGYTLNWTANITGANATLFSMSPMNGTNLTADECNSTEVAVNTTGLPMGTYYANITINSTDTAENVTVPVTLNLGVPAISTTPASLTFTTSEGEDPPDQTLEVCNSGSGTLNWSLTDNAGWLSETPTSGSLGEGECEDVTVSVDVTGLAPGDYSATITITGSPVQEVPVNLHIVSAMPEIQVGPAQLSASALSISPQQVQPGQDVTISISVANTGGETGSYNAILYINGVVEDSQSVSVAGGTSKNVIFTVSKSQAGVYDVSLAGQNGQFDVVSTGWFGGGLGTGGIIAIVVIVIALIVALVFILRGTTRPE